MVLCHPLSRETHLVCVFSCKRSPMGLLCPLFLFGFRAGKKVNPNITGQLRYRSVDYGFRKMDKSGLDRICWWCLCQDARVQFCNDRLCIREDSMHVTTRSWHNPLGAFGCVAVKSALHMSSFQQCHLLVQMPERVAPPHGILFFQRKASKRKASFQPNRGMRGSPPCQP